MALACPLSLQDCRNRWEHTGHQWHQQTSSSGEEEEERRKERRRKDSVLEKGKPHPQFSLSFSSWKIANGAAGGGSLNEVASPGHDDTNEKSIDTNHVNESEQAATWNIQVEYIHIYSRMQKFGHP